MVPEYYNLIFSGKVLVGQDRPAVCARLGALLAISGAQLDRLFSGNPVTLKRGVDLKTATRYRTAFHKAGAILELQKTAPPQASGSARSGPNAVAAASRLSLAPARSGSLLDCAPVIVPARIPDLSGMSLAAHGEPLLTSPVKPVVPPIEAPDVELAPPGEVLLENPPEQAPPRVDTKGMSLAPARSGSLADCAPKVAPIPIPDVSALRLEQPEEQGKKS